MIWTFSTPSCNASKAQVTFGIIPFDMVLFLIRFLALDSVIEDINLFFLSRIPGTFVNKISLVAFRAPAIFPATWSAFIL